MGRVDRYLVISGERVERQAQQKVRDAELKVISGERVESYPCR